MHHKRLQAANKTHTLARRRSTFVSHFHGRGAVSLKTEIYDATTELDDKISLRVFSRSPNVQEPTGSPTGSPAGDPERGSAGELQEAPRQHVQSDHFLQNKSRDAEFDGAGNWSWVTARSRMPVADIVKVNDPIEDLDLPKNTKSSKKYKITIDESAEEVEKAKTTINNFVINDHDEVTHPDEVHEEGVVQLLHW